MNWLERSAWIYGDTSPDTAKAKAAGVRTIYIDPRQVSSAAVRDTILANGLNVGIYEANAWYPDVHPAEFADIVHSHVKRLIPQSYWKPTQAEGAPVMLDLEPADFWFAKNLMPVYRQRMPVRETAITTEPWKGDGRIFPVDDFKRYGVHWYPQVYLGDMSPVDAAGVCLDAARALGDPSRVHPMYDGAAIPAGVRDGCFFTLERMP